MITKKLKVSSLKGLALDWAVEYALLTKKVPNPEQRAAIASRNRRVSEVGYSTNWDQGGPIIEQEKIDVNFSTEDNSWIAGLKLFDEQCDQMYKGPTPLIAAMRCYVASKFGDTIEIPEKLC